MGGISDLAAMQVVAGGDGVTQSHDASAPVAVIATWRPFLTLTGDDLRELRQFVGLSQAELARRLHFSRAYICDVEAGRRTFPTRNYEQLLDILERAKQGQDHHSLRFRSLRPSA